MTWPRRSELGLSLIETLIAITIFALMTMGIVPLLGTAMRGSAATKTESVGRNLASKTMERLRGLQYHVPHSGTPRKVDLLDHFFPGRTPAYAPPTTKTGFDAVSNSFVTTCDGTTAGPPCATIPASAEVPAGFSVEIRLTFKDLTNPATTVAVPAAYAWDAAGGLDVPPSQLAEVSVTTAWTVGARQRTFNLTSYLGDRKRGTLPQNGGGGAPPPPGGGGGGSQPPPTVKLRAEAKIDYAVQGTTTFRDTQSPPRKTEVTMTMGVAQAYGEQLDSGSKANLTVRAGHVTAVRAADPAVTGDVGVNASVNGAALDVSTPPDATANTTVTSTLNSTLDTAEVNAPMDMGYVSASQVGTLSGTRFGPTVSNNLPFVKGYYDFNGVDILQPSSVATHMWMNPQYSTATPGSDTTENPYDVRGTGSTYKQLLVRDMHSPSGTDPRGEVEIDSTALTPAASRKAYAKANIVAGGSIMLVAVPSVTTGTALVEFQDFTASVTCDARADTGTASTATGSWSTQMFYYQDTNNNGSTSRSRSATTLPTQTRTDNTNVPNGDTNPLQTIRNLNNGNGPLYYDHSNNTYDVYYFEGNGRRGLFKDWSTSGLQTSVSGDDRVVSAAYNGIIRVETNPVRGPWAAQPTGSTSYPDSDMTMSLGKLSCKAEDYR